MATFCFFCGWSGCLEFGCSLRCCSCCERPWPLPLSLSSSNSSSSSSISSSSRSVRSRWELDTLSRISAREGGGACTKRGGAAVRAEEEEWRPVEVAVPAGAAAECLERALSTCATGVDAAGAAMAERCMAGTDETAAAAAAAPRSPLAEGALRFGALFRCDEGAAARAAVPFRAACAPPARSPFCPAYPTSASASA